MIFLWVLYVLLVVMQVPPLSPLPVLCSYISLSGLPLSIGSVSPGLRLRDVGVPLICPLIRILEKPLLRFPKATETLNPAGNHFLFAFA